MSEVRLVVREADRDWSGTIHGSCADRAIAALSADPVTLDELEVAVSRFERAVPGRRFFSNLSEGLCDEPYDAGLVVIDLVARLIVADSTYSSPGLEGSVQYHDGHRCTDMDLRYHLADDWLISTDSMCWRGVAEERRREQAAKPLRDARPVFYGRPMLEFIAREAFAAFARRDEIAAAFRPKAWPGEGRGASPFYDTISQIHAAWMLTPREDLGGACPREVALDRRGHLVWDMQDRCEQWSLTGVRPPRLAKSSPAYRYGGFGTHELVKYYDLLRELLWSCWEHLTEQAETAKATHRLESMTVGDFLAGEIPRLEKVSEAWLDTPDPECHGRTPRSIIDRERARLPLAMSSHEAMHDPDCPCCQMAADMPGQAFWHLDGSGMDDDFAFDMYKRTRAEWDEERRRWEEYNRRFNAEWAERERLGVRDSISSADGSANVWSRSFSVGDTANVPLGVRVFGIGCHLAELIVGLRAGAERENTPPEAQRRIDQLNRDFGNLREILQSDDSSLAQALIDPVLDRFTESLSMVATARPDLAPQCEALVGEVRQLLDPPAPKASSDSDDTDVPF
jgi:hypothetical protein